MVILLGLAAPYLPSLARKAEYQMIRTIDGDTLELADGERVRVLNIDAPEMPPGSRCAAEEALALEARERLRELIKGADDITLRPGGDGRDRDRYGRLLRLIEIDGADAGNVLISEGLAQPWTGRHAEWC